MKAVLAGASRRWNFRGSSLGRGGRSRGALRGEWKPGAGGAGELFGHPETSTALIWDAFCHTLPHLRVHFSMVQTYDGQTQRYWKANGVSVGDVKTCDQKQLPYLIV